MKATLLVRRRIVLAQDAFAEVVIWRVPQHVPPSTHDFKYRLGYVVAGECVVRFDNDQGKGDHRHIGALTGGNLISTPVFAMPPIIASSEISV